MLPRPPEIDAGGGAGDCTPVGLDQGAIDVDVGVPGRLRRQQSGLQLRGEGGENGDALVEVGVRGGLADGVVHGQLFDAGAIEEPADDQDRLLEAAQGAAVLTGTPAQPFGVQQAGEVQHGLLAHAERGGVCDTHRRRGTSVKLISEGPPSYRGFAPFRVCVRLMGGSDLFGLFHQAGQLALTRNGSLWREFANYARQARVYFAGAQVIPGTSSALLYYYAALQLAKAELLATHAA